jgi:hypothetical protein
VGLIAFAVAAARRLAHVREPEPGAAARKRAELRRADEARTKERRRKRKVSGGG